MALAHEVRELIVATDGFRHAMSVQLGVSVTASAVLGHLLHNGVQTPSLISARVGMSPASTTALLDRLERAQLLRRTPHPTDRRSVHIGLTDLGHAAIAETYSLFASAIDSALDRADARLREDSELTRTLSELLVAMAAELRARTADPAGTRVTRPEEAPTADGPDITERHEA